MSRSLRLALPIAALLVACRNEPPPRATRPSTPAARAAAPVADVPPPPPAIRRVALVSAMPVVEELAGGRWRITLDVTLQNETASSVNVALADVHGALAGADGGLGSAFAPRRESTLREGPLEASQVREGRLVFEGAPAPGGHGEFVLRWAPQGAEASEVRHPVMAMPGVHPIPLNPELTAADAGAPRPAAPRPVR